MRLERILFGGEPVNNIALGAILMLAALWGLYRLVDWLLRKIPQD